MIWDELAGMARSAGALAEDWLSPSIRLGVTGLSRAGKTVFITALVHNLINGGRLPFLAAAAEGRILRAFLQPQPDDGVPRFAYEDHIAALTARPPRWPESTRQISQLRLTLEYEPVSFLRRQLGTATMHIDIVDYPGEWLLDLPLLKVGYEEWSADALSLARATGRGALAEEWLRFIGGLDPKAHAEERTAIDGAKLFTAYLAAARANRNLPSTLTPGRMLMPGEFEGSPALTFMPLDVRPESTRPAGSLHAMMARRFEAYKSLVVTPFFRDHFSRLERQIVLVDVLGAMSAGAGAMADLERALADILDCFRPGSNSWLSTLLGKRIDRILFAATKADHIHHTSHDRLEAILRLLVEHATRRAEFSGAAVRSAALAAVRATREIEADDGGGRLGCIAGTPLPGESLNGQRFDGNEEVALFPGDLPALASDALDGRALTARGSRGVAVQTLRFAPPPLQPRGAGAGVGVFLPHIRLDRAVQFLIGDKFA